IHHRKIVHLDLKPANFLLVRGKIKLSDFGLGGRPLAEHEGFVARQGQCGTPRYMAPEAFWQRESPEVFCLRPAADVWSLGIMFYSILYGHAPFQ
ncbi:unnamed protein product, partial [Amoebophrya sp. A25]